MILFSDTDIVLKLASMDLLGEALAALGMVEDDVRLLPAARFYLKSPKLESRYPAAGVMRARAFAKRVAAIESEPPLAEFQCMLDANLDSGEAGMFACASGSSETLVTTGDKRALQALSDDPACTAIVQCLSGKVICLEYLMLKILENNDFPALLPRIVDGFECDTAIRVAFGSGMKANRAHVIDSLTSLIEELDQRTARRLLLR